jgi:opacity protein-like surface antigen|eukprot:TRINITY_DN22379_c0_g1_i1.p1 TRINITY_DN22379_c0_g1~~TRINITY_DN22379_c0_g1_i1.p1  ORF type:complete len:187 (+),score=32.45 TRINITY_DN22379_c0_g1_i1:335-895(+)
MIRVRQLIGLAAVVAAPALLSAQASSDKPVSFGISGGLSMPMGDLSDAVNSGFAVAGHVYFKPASLNAVRLRGDVSYDKWGSKSTAVKADFRSLGFVGNAIIDVKSSSSVQPYLIGGAGLFNSKFVIDLGTTTGSTPSSTDFGIQAGAGLTFKLSGFDTFAEAKFVNVFADGGSTNWLPITFGIRF